MGHFDKNKRAFGQQAQRAPVEPPTQANADAQPVAPKAVQPPARRFVAIGRVCFIAKDGKPCVAEHGEAIDPRDSDLTTLFALGAAREVLASGADVSAVDVAGDEGLDDL